MPTVIVVPKMGLKMESATLLHWFKAEGEPVAAGEEIAEIETDKVSAPVTAPAGGVLVRVVAQPGDTLPVGAVLGYVGETAADLPPEPAADAEKAGARPPGSAGAAAAAGPAQAAGAGEPPVPGRLSPAARRVARELGVDPEAVARAYPGVRVTREDVRRWASSGVNGAATDGSVSEGTGTATDGSVSEGTGTATDGSVSEGTGAATDGRAPAPAPAAAAAGCRVPASPMRQTIARRMMESLRESAQLTLTREVDVTELVRIREQLAPQMESLYGVRPTYTDFLIRAMALAVPAVPAINARWEDEAVVLLSEVNVGVAVALEEGLMVPVVYGANRLPLLEISRRVRDLSERSRGGRLQPGETSGATITLTNLGAEGIDGFTPILNPPEVAILGAGRIRTVPALVNGALAERRVMTLSLTIDHRVVDGAPGARYLGQVAELLASPLALLVA